MREDTQMGGRRLTDLNRTADFLELMLEMQQNSLMLKNVTEKVATLPELSKKVEVLVSQMDAISKEVDTLESIKELVGWHERLWKIIATICVLLFPSLLASVIWIWTQVADMQNRQNLQEYKLQLIEKSNEESAETTESSPGDHKLARDFWHFDSPRTGEFSLYRIAVEEQSSESELHSDWRIYLHL